MIGDKHQMKDGVIKRGSTYSYVVRERNPQTGKTKPRWVGGFPTATAAKRARDKARSATHDGTYVAPQDLTVSAWLDRWMDGHKVTLKPSTAASYEAKIETYLKPKIGFERVQALSPSRLSVVFRELHESGGKGGVGVSARTVEYCRAILRKALADAVVERVIAVNPVAGSKIPKREHRARLATWNAGQLRAFIEATAEARLGVLWHLAAATGMRRGELLALTWAEVDLDKGIVSVERSTTQIGKEVVTTDTKNHENRTVKLDPHTTAAIRAWRKRQAEERLAWGPAYAATNAVFTWEDGTTYLPDYITKAFLRAQASVDVPRLVLHGLRHSHATELLRSGVPVHIVAKRLGHKDPSVTLRVYADVIPADDDHAADVFSAAVWGA